MQRLILLRHGKAESDSVSGEDFDRRLTPRGVRESAAMAATLADLGFSPDLALVSPAARARETWEAAAASFPGAQASFRPELYLADADTILSAAESVAAGTVMIVGHNPGLQELAIELMGRSGAPAGLGASPANRFPTAAAAVFLFDGNGRPSPDGLFFPEGRF